MRLLLFGSLGKAGMAKSREPSADLPALYRVAPGRRLGKLNWPTPEPKPGNALTARRKDAVCKKRLFTDGGNAPDDKFSAIRWVRNLTRILESGTITCPDAFGNVGCSPCLLAATCPRRPRLLT
eukprot:16441060-Heterocapsa_arctica.AAC.1